MNTLPWTYCNLLVANRPYTECSSLKAWHTFDIIIPVLALVVEHAGVISVGRQFKEMFTNLSERF